jgi:hypothetical protein
MSVDRATRDIAGRCPTARGSSSRAFHAVDDLDLVRSSVGNRELGVPCMGLGSACAEASPANVVGAPPMSMVGVLMETSSPQEDKDTTSMERWGCAHAERPL